MPAHLRSVGWTLLSIGVVWGLCLALILTQVLPCTGMVCRVATLGHHTAVLLGFAGVCASALIGIAVTTRGFSKGNGWEVTGIAIAGAAGGIALLGVAALLSGLAIVLATFVVFFGALTFTP